MSTSSETTTPAAPPRRGVGLRETLALLGITIGSIVFSVLGWLAGVVLLWTSTVWSTREKLVGTLVLPGGLAPAYFLLVGGLGGYSCTSTSWRSNGVVHPSAQVCEGTPLPGWLGWLALIVLVGAPIVTALWLGRVAVRRARQQV